MTTDHAERCRDGHTRATWRKANDPLTDRLRDRVILRAIEAGCDSEGIRAALNQARADIEDGVMSSDGRLTWNYG
jgi:hypothetical protein